MKYFIAKADIPSSINRIYPKEVLQEVVDDFHETMFGMLGYQPGARISLALTSHLIISIFWEEGDLWADIEIPCLPKSKELLAKLDKIVFRMFGIGVCNCERGFDIVQPGFKLISICAIDSKIATSYDS